MVCSDFFILHKYDEGLFFADYSVREGNCTTGDMRLADFTDDPARNLRSGQLQVCVNGAWGAVCSDTQFGYAEMAVACSHMGFSATGNPYLQKENILCRSLLRYVYSV